MQRVDLVVFAFAFAFACAFVCACSSDATPARDAAPDVAVDSPMVDLCTSAIGACAEQVPLALAGTWTLSGNTTGQPPGTAYGPITLELTFAPVSAEGCLYTVTVRGAPANADAYWPDPAAADWHSNGYSAAMNALRQVNGKDARISWSYCQRQSDGMQQVTGATSVYQSSPQPSWIAIESFVASTVTKQ